jgi:hypothetical protein
MPWPGASAPQHSRRVKYGDGQAFWGTGGRGWVCSIVATTLPVSTPQVRGAGPGQRPSRLCAAVLPNRTCRRGGEKSFHHEFARIDARIFTELKCGRVGCRSPSAVPLHFLGATRRWFLGSIALRQPAALEWFAYRDDGTTARSAKKIDVAFASAAPVTRIADPAFRANQRAYIYEYVME